MTSVPTIDIAQWRAAAPADRTRLASDVDHALCTSGFLLVTNHGVPDDLAVAVRRAAAAFFALPRDEKARYAVRVGGRGWIPPGAESNSYASGVAAPPDLKESFKVGSNNGDGPGDDPVPVNVWPAEVPAFRSTVQTYMDTVWTLTIEMFELFAAALGLVPGSLAQHAARSASSLNLNHYPSLKATGAPEPGQFRIGPHTDFGVLTILDRQVGYGGLQIQTLDGTWIDAPHVPGALTVNIGDLMSRWTRTRWRSTMHRVLPPSNRDADEALLSLVSFCGVDASTIVAPLDVEGPDDPAPVRAGDYLLAKLTAIDTGP